MPPVPPPTISPGAAPASPEGSQRRLFLHVGLPKSGTTSLQEVLGYHRETLREHGHCYPDIGPGGHFEAALEMTGKAYRWGRDDASVAGSFAALVEQGRSAGRDVVISHEIFGQARPEQIPAIIETVAGFELHLVLTVRDLGRVVPAAWQEWVKNGKRGSFDDFVQLKASRLPEVAEPDVLFWRLQNVVEVLDRWAPFVPVERVHVVTCPKPGAPRDELWRRFAAAIDFPADAVEINDVPRANESIGAAQVTFLRHVNRALDGRLPEPHGERLRKHWLAQRLLSAVEGEKARAPRETVELFAPVSHAWAQAIAERGHPVHGDLDDMIPALGEAVERHPDAVSAEEQLDGIPGVVAEMLLKIRAVEERAERAEAALAAAEARAEAAQQARLGPRLRRAAGAVRRRLARPSATAQ